MSATAAMARRSAVPAGSEMSSKRARLDGEGQPDTTSKKQRRVAAATTDSPPRRSRRAAETATAATAAQMAQDAAATAVPERDVILERALAPMTDEERAAWKGWAEVESEPAFFNSILSTLGVQGATIHEVFSIDEMSTAFLPNPVGLIFLYKFLEEEDDAEVQDAYPDDLWFANQTTANACATLAIFNIVMNCPGLRLGHELARFRAATEPLPPALRGHLLSAHPVIRAAHNSFARRLDMLLSDVTLQGEWAAAAKRKKKVAATATAAATITTTTTTTTTATATATSRQAKSSRTNKNKAKAKADDEPAFHFIAYVPRGADVWELNGMQKTPLRLSDGSSGSSDSDWTAAARERIAARMQAHAQIDETAVFSLLAVCQADREGEGETDGQAAAPPQQDYTPAVHRWVQTLAEKGVLQQLAAEGSNR